MFGEPGFLKKLLMPGLMQVAHCEGSNDGKKCKPSELPIYKEAPKPPVTEAADDEEVTAFEQKTSQIRKGIFNTMQTATDFYDDVSNKVNLEQAKVWSHYLQEEENMVPRAGAIALGGMTGLIFGLRGGIFRKLIYTSAGTLTMASVCYPKTAAEYSHYAVEDSKRYLTIAYNFVYGVKPGDPQRELPSLPIPTSFSEVWSLTTDIGRSAKNMILGDKTDENKSSEPKGSK